MQISVPQKIILLFLVLTIIFSVRADTHHLRFLQTQWTNETGLPQSSVTSIAQTDDGYLWVATFGGLARFDGVKFKVFTPANTPELKSNRIIALATDQEKNLWIGTERGEIIVYRDGVFKLVDDGKNYENKQIYDIYVDNIGKIWIASSGGGRTCTLQGCTRIGSPEKQIHKFRKDNTGKIWVHANQKLLHLENGKLVPDENLKLDVLNIETNKSGGLWLVTTGKLGIYKDGEFTPKIEFEKQIVTTSMTNHPDGSFLFNQNQILYQIKNEKIESYEINNVTFIGRQVFVDREGNIWLGRNVDGLIRLVERQVENIIIEPQLNEGKPIAAAINSIVEDRDGSVWLSTNPNLYRWRDGKVEKMPNDLVNFKFGARGALLIDSKGTLWNSTSEGLRSYTDGKLTLHQDISWQSGQVGNCLFEDSRKNLWFGNPEFGVIVWNGSKIIARYTKENGLVDNAVTFIKETRDGAIWLATRGGISRLQNGQFTNWTTTDGLSNDNVRDIYEDADGTIWIGTYGGGLNRFRDGKFTPIMSKNGLYDDIVSRILVDENDNFWMLGNRGIYSVSRQMLNDFADGKLRKVFCLSFNKADGMRTSEGNGGYQNAGIRARDGKLWFPTIDGVVVIDPKKEKLSTPKPIIEEVIMESGLLKLGETIEINYDNDDVEFHYTATSFRKPEQIRFRYRLLGFESNGLWEEVGTRRTAYYPNIPPGEYTFQVIASNSDGNWSEEIAELKVLVYPPFYLTWWFITLSVLLFFTLIVLAVVYRKWQVERKIRVREEFARRLLNAQDKERQRFASDIHDNLGQQLLIIKNWASFCLNKIPKTSKIRPQINQINETAEIALNDVRAIAKNLSPYHLDKAGLTNTLEFMIKQVADACGIEIKTQIDNIDGLLSKEDELNIYRIAQESINNIVKHSQATVAKVVLEINENDLKLEITDNGIGFYQADKNYQDFGTGLNGMIERARMLNGNLTIKSIPQKGTQISLEKSSK